MATPEFVGRNYPKLDQIEKQKFLDISLDALPEWNALMGLQFENLVLNNRKKIFEALNIDPLSILQDGPYFQNKTKKHEDCQIDYIIQTKYNTIYVCEIKFSQNVLNHNVVKQVAQKIDRLKLPRGFACIPVLLHVNEVTQSVIDSEFFGKIINVCDWLE